MEIDIKEGMSFYGGKFYPVKFHVVTILFKEPNPQVVLKYWSRVKRRWIYKVDSLSIVQYEFRMGSYSMDRKISIFPRHI